MVEEGREDAEEVVNEPLILPDIIRDETRFVATLFGYHQAINFNFVTGFEDILKNFESLEKYCDAPSENSSYFNRCTVDLSIAEALQSPRRMAARTPMDLMTYHQFTLQHLKSMWCRLVSHYFEWLAGVPEIRKLSEIDKLRLVTRQLCKVICWTAAWRTFQLGLKEGMTFGCGLVYNPKEEVEPRVRNFAYNLSEVVQRLIVSKMRSLKITRHEYLLVKLATLFSNTRSIAMSSNGQATCSSALNKYTTALIDTVKSSRPEFDEQDIYQRVISMLNLIPNLETVSDVDNRHLMELTLNNQDNLKGLLTTEIHVHSRI